MNVKILEARRYSSAFSKTPCRTVKDYELDIERTDGRIYRYCGKEYVLSRQDVLFRTPGGTVSSVGAQDSYIVTVDFSDRVHSGAYSRNTLGELQPLAQNDLLTRLPPVIHPRDSGALLQLYKALVEIPDRSCDAAIALFYEILYTLNAEIAHSEYERTKPRRDAVDIVLSYMIRHLSDDLTLPSLAAVAGLEKSYLIRQFKQRTGKTPIEMLIEMRLDHASDLVATTDMKIHEIAEASGYKTPSFFISEYKKRFGVTPEAHRLVLQSAR